MTGGSSPIGRGGPRHASWLELFYDLLFVALFAQLAHELVDDLRAVVVLGAFGLFAPAWWAWVSYTVSTNLFGESGPGYRLLIVTNMASLLVMTAGVGSAFDGDPALYAAGFAASRVVLLVLVATWHVNQQGAATPVGSYACYSTSVVLWGVSIVVGPPVAYGLWALSLAVELAVRLAEQSGTRRRADMPPLDPALLVERFGLIVIVALGEGVVGVGDAIARTDASMLALGTGIAAFAILASLWWWYFDFASTTILAAFRDQPDRAVGFARDVYVLGHYALVGAIVSTSAGLGPIIEAAADSASTGSELDLVSDGLALIVITIALISVRLGAGIKTSTLVLVPTVPVLVVVAVLGDRVSPVITLFGLAAALSGAAQLQRVHAR